MTETKDLKMVSDYTGMSFDDILRVDCITFKILLKDAFIDYMSSSEEGRDLLEQAYLLTKTEPDRESLRKFM